MRERQNASPMCYELNGGGGAKLASHMWQSREAREREQIGNRETDNVSPSSEAATMALV
jgi:hypothetical protein